jgi:hypothetical protein
MANTDNSDVPTRVKPYAAQPTHGVIYNTLDWLGFDVEEPAKLTKALEQRGRDLDEVSRASSAGEINSGEALLRRSGAYVGGFADAFAGTVDMVTPDRITEPLGEAVGSGVQWGMDKTGATEYMQKNPRAASNIMAGMEVLGGIPSLKGLSMLDGKKVRPENTHGGFLSSPSNYIANWYGIDDKWAPNSLVEEYVLRGVTGANLAFKQNPNNPVVKTLQTSANAVGKALDKVPVLRGGSALGRKIVNALDFKDGKEGLALARKIVGFGTWGMEEGMQALMALSQPSARALWKEQGVNKRGQKLISKHLLDAQAEAIELTAKTGRTVHMTKTKAFQKAVAQSIYMRYIGEQAGRKGNYNKAYNEVFDKSTFGGITENSEAAYLNAIKGMDNVEATKIGVTAKGNDKFGPTSVVEVPDEVNSQAYKHMSDIWGIAPIRPRPQMGGDIPDGSFLIVKKPRGTGGDHQSSVYHSKFNESLNEAHKKATGKKLKAAHDKAREQAYQAVIDSGGKQTAAKEAMKNVDIKNIVPEALTDADLFMELTRKKQGTNKPAYSDVSMRSTDIADVEANGLWFSQSGSGRAITEGGINRLSKFTADGNIVSYISDQQNFLENMPVLGKLLGKALQVDEITMTPPIVHNVIKWKKPEVKKQRGTSSGDTNLTTETMEELAAAKPSGVGVAKEVGKNVVNASIAGGLFNQMKTEEEKPEPFNYNNRFNNLQL